MSCATPIPAPAPPAAPTPATGPLTLTIPALMPRTPLMRPDARVPKMSVSAPPVSLFRPQPVTMASCSHVGAPRNALMMSFANPAPVFSALPIAVKSNFSKKSRTFPPAMPSWMPNASTAARNFGSDSFVVRNVPSRSRTGSVARASICDTFSPASARRRMTASGPLPEASLLLPNSLLISARMSFCAASRLFAIVVAMYRLASTLFVLRRAK